MAFVNLHTHGHHSILDGLSTEEEIAQITADLGQSAVALTDHGTLSGALAFQRACEAVNVKPILGLEAYVAPGHRGDHEARCIDGKSTAYHLVLLALNNTGWKHLMALSTIANAEGFYRKPRIDMALLEEYNQGLFCLSGCLAGEFAQSAMIHGHDTGEVLMRHRAIFGDRYALEIQDHGIEDEGWVRSVAQRLAKTYGVPIVATGDSHYPRHSDANTHDIFLCIQTLDRQNAKERKFKFSGDGYWLQSEDEMRERFFGEAITNSGYIADMVERISFDGTPKIPAWTDSLDPSAYLVEAVQEGLERHYGNDVHAVTRAGNELEVIQHHGLADYFLIVQDIVHWAKRQGIVVGPGRGSAGGSVVAYALGITQVDPLRYNTLFERFMTRERYKLPDIDIDFSEREPVIKYIEERFGAENVAQVATFGTFGERASLRDVARALELPEDCQEVASEAQRLEGRVRGIGRHAAGVIISPTPLADHVPLMRPVGATKGAKMQTQFEYEDMERLGFLKVDVLGVQRLQTIEDARRIAGIDLADIPPEDIETYLMLSRADVDGVFQIDSYGGRKTMRALRPRNFEDLVVAVSLDRPGPLESGAYDLYIERRDKPTDTTYQRELIPEVASILKDTHGIILYQEQVLEIAQKIAGYTPGDADEFRVAMGKKKPEVMEAQHEKFVNSVVQYLMNHARS